MATSANADIVWLPACRLSELIRARELSPVDVVAAFLAQIEALEPAHHAFITVAGEQALEAARRAERRVVAGDDLGLLHGIPVSIKDILFTRGIRTTGASLLYEHHVPDRDAVAVERLRAAGAIVVGKTNLPEFSMYWRTINRVAPECRNAWDTSRTSGGSSGGAAVSAALAMNPIGIGTDDGGSIRVPAAFNGVFGILPTKGLVPIDGGFSSHAGMGIGPLCRDVRDAAISLAVLSGAAAVGDLTFLDGLESGVRGLRLAWSDDLGYVTPADPRVVAVARRRAQQLEALGAHVEEPGLRIEDIADQLRRDRTIARDPGDVPVAWLGLAEVLADPERAALLAPYVADPTYARDGATYSLRIPPDVRERAVTPLEEVFGRFDAILCPTISRVASRCEEVDYSSFEYVQYTGFTNVVGSPAASVPAGFVDDMPVGLQVIGAKGYDALLLRIARALEEAEPWAGLRPPGV